MFVQEPYQQNGDSRQAQVQQITKSCAHIIQSDLVTKMEPVVSCLDQTDQEYFKERFDVTKEKIKAVHSTIENLREQGIEV